MGVRWVVERIVCEEHVGVCVLDGLSKGRKDKQKHQPEREIGR